MRKFWLIVIGILSLLPGHAQKYADFADAVKRLNDFSAATDTTGLKTQVNQWWEMLQAKRQIPLIVEDSVIFLYRGDAKSIDWMGDFNAWGYRKDFPNKGKRVQNTNIWFLKCSFPKEARLDYKILIDGSQWLLDPENSNHQWSGVGGGSPNSELRMPNWKADPILTERPGIHRGTLKKDLLFNSKTLGYQITYSVYIPYGIDPKGKYPVLYVTDGYEYMLPELGNIVTVLDNLLADKKIQPVIAILIDHREPINRSNNRRMQELNMSEKYLQFIADEFIPAVESNLPIHHDAAHRAILGASMGGLAAAYIAFTRPDLFAMAGIQSPAFWSRPQIYTVCDNPNSQKIKVSMTSGLINDSSDGSRKMKEILQNNACVYNYRETPEGHSWGNWRNLIDDILVDFFALP